MVAGRFPSFVSSAAAIPTLKFASMQSFKARLIDITQFEHTKHRRQKSWVEVA